MGRSEPNDRAAAHAETVGDIPEAGRLANQLGVYLHNRARLRAAVAVLEAAERIDREAYGDDHPNVAIRVSNTGSVLYARGDMEGAREKALEAFDIRIRRLVPRRLSTLLSARNLVAVGVDPIAEARRIAGDEVAEQLRGRLAEDGENPDAESRET